MTILRAAAQWLNDMREKALAKEIAYIRADGMTLTLKATLGSTTFNSRDDYGVVIEVESRDFIVRASDLDFIPSFGDRIECDGDVFDVLAPDGKTPWKWTDPYKSSMRIHTKFLSEANEE